jgi:hypothetical protein
MGRIHALYGDFNPRCHVGAGVTERQCKFPELILLLRDRHLHYFCSAKVCISSTSTQPASLALDLG